MERLLTAKEAVLANSIQDGKVIGLRIRRRRWMLMFMLIIIITLLINFCNQSSIFYHCSYQKISKLMTRRFSPFLLFSSLLLGGLFGFRLACETEIFKEPKLKESLYDLLKFRKVFTLSSLICNSMVVLASAYPWCTPRSKRAWCWFSECSKWINVGR